MSEPVLTPTISRLAEYLLDGVVPLAGDDLPERLRRSLGGSSRFAEFAEANRDKIRKKLRVAREPDARSDVLAELEVAFLLLGERRIELAFEAYGSGKKGPDFTVTWRAAHRFNLEVTRPRVREGTDAQAAIGSAVLGKLRQLPVEVPNAVFVAAALARSGDEVTAAVRALKLRADRRDEAFFAARGLSTAEFKRQYRRLATVLVGDESGGGVHAWTNREAPRQLPAGAATALLACLSRRGRGAVTPAVASDRSPG